MIRHPTRFPVARFSGFFFLFIFFHGHFSLCSFSDSNAYLDTGISIISLRFGGLELTLVGFSPLFKRFSLCLHISLGAMVFPWDFRDDFKRPVQNC